MNVYGEILKRLAAGEAVSLETRLEGKAGELRSQMSRSLGEIVPVLDAKGRRCAQVTAEREGDRLTVREPIQPQERLLVLGGGHIALHVVEFAAKCGFSVTVADDRPDFANRQRFPLAEQVICDSF